MSDDLNFKRKFLISFCLSFAVLSIGSVGFWLVGGGEYTLFDSVYMTVITVSTVGYGEVIDLTDHPGGRTFAMFIIFAGMGIIVYFISNVTAYFVEVDLKEMFWRKRMKKLIQGMKDHYIVCGTGTTGIHVVEEFHRTGRPVVAVDIDAQKMDMLRERYDDVGLIVGDASENDILAEAGIEQASGVVVATTSDKDNLLITVSARQLNSSVRIVARCSDIKYMEKLRRSGADTVVSSNFIGGMRLASEMIRPKVTTFLDRMLRDQDRTLRVEEILLPEDSPLTGLTLSAFRKHVLVVAVYAIDEEYVFNPQDDYVVKAGDTVVFIGSPEDRQRLLSSVD